MQDDAAFLRSQAEKCRWLAQRINDRDVVDSLLQMARTTRRARPRTGKRRCEADRG
jgi:hypothetical protein